MSVHNHHTRLEAFCDGVFAIAATLLIIEIKVPSAHEIHSNQDLYHALLKAWPSWVAFFLSFITILISWVNHSHFLKLLDKTSAQFTYANGLLLLTIIILPFPTAAVGAFIQTDYAQPAISLYCLVFLINNIAWMAIIFSGIPLRKSSVNMDKINANIRYVIMGFVLYALTFALSFWFPLTAFSIVALTYVGWLILGISIRGIEAAD